MINNYVKKGIIMAPVKKKYSRYQLAAVIMIAMLKGSFSIPSIHEGIKQVTINNYPQQAYDRFVDLMNARLHNESAAVDNQLDPVNDQLINYVVETLFNRMQAAVETKLAVSVTPWIAQSLLAATVNRFLAVRPDVSLNLVETFGTDYTALREGTLDIAVGLAPEQTPSDLIGRPLFSYEQAIVCRRGHPLQEARTLASLSGQSWILSHGIDQYKSPLREFFVSAYGDPACQGGGRLHYSRSTLIALQMIENSDMLCLMPSPLLEAVRDRYRVEGVALEAALPHNTTSYLTRRNTPVSGAIAQFIAALIETVKADCQIENRLLRRVYHSFESLHKG